MVTSIRKCHMQAGRRGRGWKYEKGGGGGGERRVGSNNDSGRQSSSLCSFCFFICLVACWLVFVMICSLCCKLFPKCMCFCRYTRLMYNAVYSYGGKGLLCCWLWEFKFLSSQYWLKLSSDAEGEKTTGSTEMIHWFSRDSNRAGLGEFHGPLQLDTDHQVFQVQSSSSSWSRLCPSTAGCSPPSMSSIVICLLLSRFTFHLGFVHPLQDVALHQCISIVFCLLLSRFTFHLGFVHPLQDVALHQCISIVFCLFLSRFTFHLGFVHPLQDVALHQCISIVFCLFLSRFTFHLGFVHPLQDVALHQCLPLSSVCCFPNPGGSHIFRGQQHSRTWWIRWTISTGCRSPGVPGARLGEGGCSTTGDFVCVRVYTHIHSYIQTCMQMCVCVCVCVCAHVHAYNCIYMYKHKIMCVCVCVCVCVGGCVCVYKYV